MWVQLGEEYLLDKMKLLIKKRKKEHNGYVDIPQKVYSTGIYHTLFGVL